MELLQDKSLLLKQFEKLNYVLRKKDLLQEITYLVQHKIVDSQSSKTAKAAADLTNRFVAYLTKRKEATAKEALDHMEEEEGFFSDFDQLYCSLNHFETVQLLNSLLQRDRE